MNVAIVIGVWNYEKLDPLPGCKCDLEVMTEVIKQTGKYAVKHIDACHSGHLSNNASVKETHYRYEDGH